MPIIFDSEMRHRCEVCGAEATMRCSRCKVTYYCSREHQVEAYRQHKKECALEATIARVLKRALAESRPKKPAGATCMYCLEDDDELVHQGCACRGNAGWVHVKCAYEGLAANPGCLYLCSVCQQAYDGTFRVCISAAKWRAHRRAHGGMLGPECEDFRSALESLSGCFSSFGEGEAALTMGLELHDYYRRNFPPQHPRSLVSAVQVGRLLRRMGRSREARDLLRPCADLWRTATARDPDCELKLAILRVYATSLAEAGDWTQAEGLFREGLEASRTHMGEDAVTTIDLLDALADAQANQHRFLEARETTSLALEKSKRVFGPDHSLTREFIARIAECDQLAL